MKCLSIVIVTCILSCNPQMKQPDPADSTGRDTLINAEPVAGCYQMGIGKDSAFLQISQDTDGVVSGRLRYKRFEKDSNDGTLEGKIDRNIIKGWYKFHAEGVISVREIYLKVTGNTISEGYGDLDMRSDTAYFRYPTTVAYEDKHPYLKVDCSTGFGN